MRRPLLCGFVTGLCLGTLARAEAVGSRVTVDRAGDAERIDVRLDGSLVDWTARRTGGNGREILLLVAQAKPATGAAKPAATEPCTTTSEPPGGNPDTPPARGRLLRLDPGRPDGIEVVRADVPLSSDRRDALLALDVDQDGKDEVMLVGGARARYFSDGPEGPLHGPIEADFEETGLLSRGLRYFRPRDGDPGPPRIPVLDRGAFRVVQRTADGAWRTSSEIPVGVEVRASRDRLIVDTRPVIGVTSPSGGVAVWGTEPEPVGQDRLRVLGLDPERGQATEYWMGLPSPERLLEFRYLVLEGKAVLVATTMSSEKLAIFSEKRVRLWRLAEDRTRKGTVPLLAAVSRMNLWQDAEPSVRDADGDGRDDLVIAYWKGLTDTILAFDVFLRREDGSFETAPRGQSFEVKDAVEAVLAYDADLDSDGVTDLALVAEGALRVYRGLADTRKAKALVEEKPSFSAPIPEGLLAKAAHFVGVGSSGVTAWSEQGGIAGPVPVRWQEDAPPSLVFWGNDGEGRGRVVFFRFGASTPVKPRRGRRRRRRSCRSLPC